MKTLRFEELNLSKDVQRAVNDMGFEEATPIQSQAIPFIMEGRDIIGQAQTGTGKTASFGIPIIETTDAHSKKIQALVLCPTRELAIQVSEELGELLKYKRSIRVIPIYGGQSIDRQFRALKQGVQIIIGTPGRVIDHINRGTINLSEIKIVVLDEADEMLDMGFRDDIEKILKSAPKERQTVMFSATMPGAILELARKYLRNPEHIKVVHKELTVPNVNQHYIELKPNMKLEVLTRLIDLHNPKLMLVFCNTKRGVDDLVSHLQFRGYLAEGLHGDMKQNGRDKVMNKFRSGKLDILVATDVAARGIDVEEIDAVINYDMPQDEEYYVHRIGRTARAGRAGQAFTFVSGKDIRTIREIERYTKTKIMRRQIPSLKDVEEMRTNVIVKDIKDTIDAAKDLSKYTHIMERLLNEDYTSEEIATGLLKMIIGNREASEKIDENFQNTAFEKSPDRRDRKNKITKSGKERGAGNFRSSEDMDRLFINVGKKQRVKPNDIVGAIANEAGIPGKSIGSIDIYDKYCFVEIPKKYSKKVIKIMNNNTIKGKEVAVEIANARS